MKIIFSSDLHGSKSGYRRFSELLASEKIEIGILGHSWTDTNLIKSINMKKLTVKDQSFAGYQYTNPFIGGEFEKTEKQQALKVI